MIHCSLRRWRGHHCCQGPRADCLSSLLLESVSGRLAAGMVSATRRLITSKPKSSCNFVLVGCSAAGNIQVRVYPWRKNFTGFTFQTARKAVIASRPQQSRHVPKFSQKLTEVPSRGRSTLHALSRPAPCVLVPRHTCGVPTMQPFLKRPMKIPKEAVPI